jgi:hypothetical protein
LAWAVSGSLSGAISHAFNVGHRSSNFSKASGCVNLYQIARQNGFANFDVHKLARRDAARFAKQAVVN